MSNKHRSIEGYYKLILIHMNPAQISSYVSAVSETDPEEARKILLFTKDVLGKEMDPKGL